MKKITLFFLLLAVSFGYSQTVLEDFEAALPGGALNAFEGLAGASVVADPLAGPNGQVAELISSAAGQPWQGASLIMQDNFIDLTTDITVEVDVYSTTAFTMFAKVEDNVNMTAPASAAATSYTTPGAWQTLTFTFNESLDGTAPANGEYSLIAFFPNWMAAGGWNDPPSDFSVYVDNITAVAGSPVGPNCNDGILNGNETGVDCGGPDCAPCDALPPVAAPTPPNRDPNEVISIFSDAYANISVDTFDTPWCPGTTTEVLVAGNPTKKVSGLGCEGVEFITGRFDATGFTHFHMDIFTNTPTLDRSFNVKFSNWDNTGGEVNALEFSVTNASTPALPQTNPGTWISLDIPLSNFTPINSASLNDVVQFVITSDLGTVYYDNLYLHQNTLGLNDFSTTSFSVFPNPARDNWTLRTNDVNISSIQVVDMLGKVVLSTMTPNSNEAIIDGSSLHSGLYFARVNTNGSINTIKLIKH